MNLWLLVIWFFIMRKASPLSTEIKNETPKKEITPKYVEIMTKKCETKIFDTKFKNFNKTNADNKTKDEAKVKKDIKPIMKIITKNKLVNEDAEANKQNKNEIEDEYQIKIEELRTAKEKYGVTEMKYLTLNNGRKMPVLSIGTALLDSRLIYSVITTAIDLGYRAIDAAFIYGNEKAVGEAIKAKIDEGTVTREELFIISKLWNTFHREDLVEPACRSSLQAMGLDYFDLYLIHNPMSFKEGSDPVPKIANVIQYSTHDYIEAWYGLEKLLSKGLVKSIGLSNFNESQLTRVVEKGRVVPAVLQVESHPYLTQEKLQQRADSYGVQMNCYGTLGSKGTDATLKSSQLAAIDDPLVQVMAAGMNVTPAQLLLSYQLKQNRTVVVKASSGLHLWENLQAVNIDLDDSEINALHALNKNRRTFTFKGFGDTHKNYPF